jgi:hypothetical protein
VIKSEPSLSRYAYLDVTVVSFNHVLYPKLRAILNKNSKLLLLLE